jgi:hypothetical protein
LVGWPKGEKQITRFGLEGLKTPSVGLTTVG